MRGSVAHGIRVLVVAGMIGLGVGQVRAQASGHNADAKGETAQELLYQGRILPIVTDVYNSLSSLGSALNNNDTNGIAQAGNEFADEQQRFEAIKPVPKPLQSAAKTMDTSLRELASGTHALVIGLRAADNNAEQQAATVLEQGIKQFQDAVGQIRHLAGPSTQSKPSSPSAAAAPTPIIKGLP